MAHKVSNQDRLILHSQRAATLIGLRKFDMAAKEARQVLHIDPHNAQAHHILAMLFERQGKLLEARKEVETAVSLAPGTAEFHSTLASILAESGPDPTGTAVEHHKRAIALAPTEPLFHARYADLLVSSGALDAAWRESEVCLRLDPRFVDAHLLQAEIFRQCADFLQAEKSARTALSIDPENFKAHSLLGDIYLETHHASSALNCYRSALRLEPTHQPLKRKVILALEARIPVVGIFWKIGIDLNRSMGRLGMKIAIPLMIGLGGLMLTQGDAGASIVCCLYCVPLVVPLGGLFLIIDPLLTHAFIKGWIKIDERLDDIPKAEFNTRLARFIKIPYLILAFILLILCSMSIFYFISLKSP